MCGIFGILAAERSQCSFEEFRDDLSFLYRISMSRGQDSTGLALNDGQSIYVIRKECNPRDFIRERYFSDVLLRPFKQASTAPLAVMGHCRLATDGSLSIEENNQPVCASNIVGIHNGIVTNSHLLIGDREQTEQGITDQFAHSAEGVSSESDSRLFIQYLDRLYTDNKSIIESLSTGFGRLEGSATVALMAEQSVSLLLATNTGSLYVVYDNFSRIFVFASEYDFLRRYLKETKLLSSSSIADIEHINAGNYVYISAEPFDCTTGLISEGSAVNQSTDIPSNKKTLKIVTQKKTSAELTRCTRCILPHSYPGIYFDQKGICNYCNNHKPEQVYGEILLERELEKYRRDDGHYDCLVGLSGGRDSSYGLYLLKKKYQMNPVAYTYDWGLTTDQSRRNQARLCGQLGIEHIIRAPNVAKKRRYIRKNVDAWLKRPELGMVPLFMAGDKDFYHYGRTIRKQYDLKLTIFCSGSIMEQNEFFTGFCGVHEAVNSTARMYGYRNLVKIRLAMFYVTQYLLNPRYINESFFDSIRSFYVSFLARDDFLYLYEYIKWDEKEIERTLREQTVWESDKAYGQFQWRMGDGQTAFTNYIFHTLAGFTEFDDFRSSQIREGLIPRTEALKLVVEDNKPRWRALQYFAHVVGLNLDEVLARVNNIPKLY